MASPMMLMLLICVTITAADEPSKAAANRLRAMSPAELTRVESNFDRFEKLPKGQQQELRDLDRQLNDAGNERGGLEDEMRRYVRWLETLTAAERARIDDEKTTEGRVKVVRELIESQNKRLGADLAPLASMSDDSSPSGDPPQRPGDPPQRPGEPPQRPGDPPPRPGEGPIGPPRPGDMAGPPGRPGDGFRSFFGFNPLVDLEAGLSNRLSTAERARLDSIPVKDRVPFALTLGLKYNVIPPRMLDPMAKKFNEYFYANNPGIQQSFGVKNYFDLPPEKKDQVHQIVASLLMLPPITDGELLDEAERLDPEAARQMQSVERFNNSLYRQLMAIRHHLRTPEKLSPEVLELLQSAGKDDSAPKTNPSMPDRSRRPRPLLPRKDE